ncbi:MAG: dephospho-CoA kinase [Thermoguttaceae bacterium]|jgi:dephospho-CoA kinase
MTLSQVSTISPITLGVVGGIGSGKSYTTAELVSQGAVRFDADAQAKALYETPSIVAKIRNRWSSVVNSNGTVDYAALARIVFAPTEAGRKELAFLNSILHPVLLQKYENWLASLVDCEFAVLDAPLLFEVGWDSRVDYVIFVDASAETRLRRTIERGWSSDELFKREARQLPLEVKKARADFIVDANRDDSQMTQQIRKILDTIREKPRRSGS